MINPEIAAIFNEIADLLELTGGDPFRVNSYRKAARSIEDLAEDVADVANRGELKKIAGVGKGTAERIMQYLTTGKINVHQELLESIPRGLPELLTVPGLGPKKVQALHRELGVGSMADLEAVIADGRAEKLSGFGKKSVEKIAEGLAFLKRSAGRTPLGAVLPLAEGLRDAVREFTGVRRVEIAGSARRGCETVGDIDLLCIAEDGEKVVKSFTKLPQVTGVRAAGETKGSVLVAGPIRGEIQVDLRVVPEESFGAALQYFTGSKEHNVRLRELAVKRGWKLNEYGLFEGDRPIAGREEAEIYEKLDLRPVPPELREDRGEIECRGEVPRLVSPEDIKGDMHIHSTASDGRSTIEEMAEAARARGYSYLAFCDHSKSSAIANGLDETRLLRHIEDIRAAGKRVKGITLLAGIECDILANGKLDYADDVLAQLDWVIASIHSAQQQDRASLTRRSIAAMENPFICCLGHPSGRLIGRRDAMDLDWDAIFAAAARTGCALEISASWQRLDLKDVHVRQAIDAGCHFAINTDAHSTEQLDQMPLGVQTARRGWATADRVLNTWPEPRLREWIAAKRKAGG
ncbi:MAG: DNA polymerase/3'-5' exonuclease PolX [Planctomycetes bacterium]|nr:DNA polymerase/3'-5' exonuclease PolX [Planctomycetota bacterium]